MAEIKTLTVNGKTYTVADPDAAHIDDSAVGETAWSSGQIARTVANALKGSVSGEGVIRVDDASPLPHEMAVKLTSEALTGFSGVTLSRFGEDYAVTKRLEIPKTTAALSLRFSRGELKETLKAGHTYTVFADITSDVEEKVYRVTNDTYKTLGYFRGDGRQSLTITIDESGSDGLAFFSAEDNATSVTVDTSFHNITIVEEATRMDCTPKADGTVEGVMSLSPTTTLIADNSQVTISVEYNKDANWVIAGQEERIAALEAAVTKLLEG